MSSLIVTAASARTLVAASTATTVPISTVSFTPIATLPGGSVAWGDYDGDGDLDLLSAGQAGYYCSATVYRNDGGDVFAETGAGLTGVCGSGVWVDYDRDGDLDILLTGRLQPLLDAGLDTQPVGHSLPGIVALLYRNDGGGAFTSVTTEITGVVDGSVAWGDYDNDGDPDLLLTGGADQYIARVYRNDGGGTFADAAAGLLPVTDSAAAWGDYDNDGDLDILLTGWSGYGQEAKVYRNDGGVFTDIGAALTGVLWGKVAWGDCDDDGDLDILLTGLVLQAGWQAVAKLYRNDGGGVFTELTGALPPLAGTSSVAWGDYDNDGDLDILLTGPSRESRRRSWSAKTTEGELSVRS